MKANYSNNWCDVFIFRNERTGKESYGGFENKSKEFCMSQAVICWELILEDKLPADIHFDDICVGDEIYISWYHIENGKNTESNFLGMFTVTSETLAQ